MEVQKILSIITNQILQYSSMPLYVCCPEMSQTRGLHIHPMLNAFLITSIIERCSSCRFAAI